MTDNQPCDQDQHITSIADAVVKLKELRESNKNLNEPDIEEKFARLSLAFKTDKFTLGKRLELQARQRDIAEKNIEVELKALRESLNALNQLCTESDMREVITKTQQHVDIVQQATMRMSSRAETYGAVQQEQRLNCAFETMLNYVEHLKLLYDKEHIELEEYRRLLAENNLLPDEKGSLDGDDSKRSLPPRSHSLSSSSKPEFLRHGSLGTFIRPPHSDTHKVISRENSAGHLSSSGVNMSIVRQKLEARTRLLSSVCLLNNNYESPRSAANGSTTPSSGSVSPKSRRSSLPVGPLAQSSHSSNSVTQITCGNRTHKYISETKNEGKESQAKHLQENVASILKAESSDSAFGTEEMETHKDPQAQSAYEKETSPQKDSRYLFKLPTYMALGHSVQRIWHWDNATLILHARYTLSVMLATAAMLTLVLTFVPNQVIAQLMKDPKGKF
ncbi:inositol 1,4,5-triphosphate receptor associated 1-like isoform X4 [Stegodyphus dumicola]|uniref:inositol 1,4,5-triphosphate receptor associated 1-like isoform X4 n=1 Tax=Stegodyphus dumicola TaxID=202533 RepID=UPI0015B0142D|nr:inositol 1,4,5-triphosphate receptor associated 1-like isoform X4 [Stegodyphus dumicola]